MARRNQPPDRLPAQIRDHPQVARACREWNVGRLFRVVNNLSEEPAKFTVTHLGRVCGLTTSRVVEYMKDAHQVTTMGIIERIADGLHIPGERFGLVPRPWEKEAGAERTRKDAATLATSQSTEEPGKHDLLASLDRSRQVNANTVRAPLTTGMVDAVVPVTDLDQVETSRRGLHDLLASDSMSEASLDDWELTVVRYGAATKDRPASLLLSDLAADFSELQHALARSRSSFALRRLTRVAAHMSGLMCLTLIKLDERGAFRRWARTARIAAREADDPATYSWVLAQESYGHFYSHDLTEAVTVAQQAQAAVTTQKKCVGGVLAAALEARAHAALGRVAETRAAIGNAETLLAALDDDSEANAVTAFGYNEAQLRFHESNALTHLGDTKTAWTVQDRALELVAPGDFMDRAFTQLDRAMCLARDRDAAGATSYALASLLELTDQQRQGIIAGRAQQLLNILPAAQQSLPSASELRDLLMLPAAEG